MKGFLAGSVMLLFLAAGTGSGASGPQRGTVLIADEQPGADLGAKINAADAKLGSSSGEIQVTQPGTVSTAVHLSSNHTLQLRAPTTWHATITLQSGDTVQCDGPSAPLTLDYQPNGPFMVASSASQITLQGCTATALRGQNANLFLVLRAVNGATITQNETNNLRLLAIGSTAPAVQNSQYRNVTDSNSSHNITVTGNVANGSPGGAGPGIGVAYARHVQIANNTLSDVGPGSIQWWGGDACFAGCASEGGKGDGAPENERKVQDLVISGNTVRHGAIWGSMGERIVVSHNIIDTCTDVCLDAEGSNDVTFLDNTVKDGPNGAVGTFSYNRNVSITGNTIISSSKAYPLLRIYNPSQNPANNKNLLVTRNHFRCLDHDICQADSAMGPFDHEVFSNNEFHNVKLSLNTNNLHDVEVRGNRFLFDVPSSVRFDAISVGGTHRLGSEPGTVRIVDNEILCNAPQPPGSRAIDNVQDDYNSNGITWITGNRIGGSHPFPVDIEVVAASGNPGTVQEFHVSGNYLGSGVIRQGGKSRGNFVVRDNLMTGTDARVGTSK